MNRFDQQAAHLLLALAAGGLPMPNSRTHYHQVIQSLAICLDTFCAPSLGLMPAKAAEHVLLGLEGALFCVPGILKNRKKFLAIICTVISPSMEAARRKAESEKLGGTRSGPTARARPPLYEEAAQLLNLMTRTGLTLDPNPDFHRVISLLAEAFATSARQKTSHADCAILVMQRLESANIFPACSSPQRKRFLAIIGTFYGNLESAGALRYTR